MIVNLLLVVIIAVICMVVLPTIFHLALKQNHLKTLKILVLIMSVVYFILLAIGVYADISYKGTSFLINFNFNHKWLSPIFLLYDFGKSNILINIFMFFPLGFIVNVFSKKHQFTKTIIYALFISIFIEITQAILPVSRATELTDIIYNTISGLFSATYCLFLNKINFNISRNLAK